ncbi:hypothetical protein TSUD_323720 [Trifolium subterraneum]|uniref:Uncharacterized protein n=1 Tax=Trifolium subterraneum TaxID=3900 RepID=A0A2Z6N3H6_TRISU|nr:hypothetical protein TSUD_323720 [Trifolium subterraneum]
MTIPNEAETPPSKTTKFTFPDDWTDMSWGFDLALGQVTYTGNIVEKTMAPYDPDIDGGSSSQQIPEPQPEMVMPLHFAEPLSSTFIDPDAIPDTSHAFAPIPE